MSNIDLGPKTICAIARSRRGASTGLFREALRPSGADRQGGGGSYQPPPLTVRVMRNALTGRGLGCGNGRRRHLVAVLTGYSHSALATLGGAWECCGLIGRRTGVRGEQKIVLSCDTTHEVCSISL